MGLPIPQIHLPKRTPKDPDDKKGKPNSEIRVKLKSEEGTLRAISAKSLIIDSRDKDQKKYRLLAKTQFFDKEGDPMRDSLLKPGDHLQVSFNPDDEETALRVTLLKAGSEAERESAAKNAPPASADDDDPPSAASDSSTRVSKPPANDDDTFVLRRGKQDHPAHEEANDAPPPPAATTAEAKQPQPATDAAEYKEVANVATAMGLNTDPIIAEARDAASEFSDRLPNFIVQQLTTRYASTVKPPSWQAIDIVSAEVAVVDGKEDYRKITINGRPTKQPIEKTGSWSTGEFAATMDDILNPYTAAKFVKRAQQRFGGRDAYMYDYTVKQQTSHWNIIPQNSKAYTPAYKGSIWIDKETKRVLKITQHATYFPDDFEFDRADVELEYGFVRISGKQFLLPTRSENIICQRGSTVCTRNEINFRNYRQFGAESAITFEDKKP